MLYLKPQFRPFFSDAIRGTILFLCTLAWIVLPTQKAWAWPADSQWLELVKGEAPIQDSESDANGGVNVVPDDGTHAAAYIYNDGAYLYYRIRLDDDPSGTNGVFDQFGWGFEIDIDQNAADYEWLIMCDGISSPEVISLRENTDKTGLGDPSDKAEYVAAEYPLVGNHRLSLADTSINGDQDYFLDFRMPYTVFKTATGITDDTLIRYFVGSSRSTNNLTENGADLVAGSNLYEMASDYISPFGTLPSDITFYDGSVRFTEDTAGNGDVNLASPGDRIYITVSDQDLTSITNPTETIRVELTSPTGDSEIVILTATGVQGKYSGSILTTSGKDAPSILQVMSGQTVTVTYLDAVDATFNQNVARTDTLLFNTTGTDVAITKSVDTPVANEGDAVTFTITATNNGPDDLTVLNISDSLPAGLTLTSATPSQGSFGSGTWSVGGLTVGNTATLTLLASVQSGTSGSTLTNTANLSSSSPSDLYAANDTASASVDIGGTDLRIIKDVTESLPTEGEQISYRIRILNLGPNQATGVQVQDLLPAGVTYVSDNSGGSYNPTTGIWNVGSIAADDGYLLRIDVQVDSGTFGQVITNTASVAASDQPDPDSSNNTESVNIKVDFLDLELTKTVDDETPDEGDTITFSVRVDNNGPHDATGISVTDLLPPGTTFSSATVSQGSYSSGTGLWNLGDLDANDHATLTITATVDAGKAGQTITNEAEIASVDQPDSSPGNESDTAAIHVSGTDLQVVKTVSNPTPIEGEQIDWIITITNNGPNPASGVEITDILPGGVSILGNETNFDYTATQGAYSIKNGSVWSVGDLDAGNSATLTVPTTVDSGTSGQTITNVAFLTASDQLDSDAFNNSSSAQIAVDGTDLALTKTVDNATPLIGETVTYTITLSNTGRTATNIVVNDLLPPELAFVSASGTYNPAIGNWSVSSLADGASTSFTLQAQVLDNIENLTITNTASITAMDQADVDTTNNSASVDISINATDLAIAKSVDNSTPDEETTITYTVTLTNNGPNEATNIEVDDILPAGVTYVSATPSQGNYAAGLWLVGDLVNGATATLSISATVDPGTGGSTITNVAEITSLDQIDTVDTNDTASVDITPTEPPAMPDIKITKSVATKWDPYNGFANPFDIPGGIVEYTLTITNEGLGSPDDGSILITDPIPTDTALVVSDPVITINNVTADTGLSISYVSPTDVGDDVYFSQDGSNYGYQPFADSNNVDASITHLQINPQGILSASDGTTHPSFQILFRVRIK